MSSRRVEDAPPDPADVEDMRLRIEAHQRASEAEAASARAFRSECERAHGEFLRACARLEEERRARHAKQLEVMEATYARARLATPAVSAESLALRGLARGIARGLAARESARGGTLREDEGVVVRPEENAASKNAASTASDRFALAALERAASEAESRARETYVARVAGDMQARCAAIKKTHDREAVEFAAARGDAERAILDARNQAASRRFRVENRGDAARVKKTRLKRTSHAALVADAAARATRAATAAARAIAERSEEAHAETRRDAARALLRTRDGVSGPDAVAGARAARGGVFVRGGPASPRLASPRRTRLASEKARRIERAARASFAKGVGSARDGGDERFSPTETRRRRKKPNRVATSSDERRAGVLVFGPDDDAFSDDARFVTARGGYADARVDDDDDHDGGVRSVHEGTTFEGEDDLRRSSSSSSSSSDDEAKAVATETDERPLSFGDASAFRSARFAAPGNRHRREARSRARVGEARVAALGARGDDSKGFGALGEAGVAFAESRPAGRRNQTRAKVFGDAFFAKASSSKETKTPSFVRSNEDTSLGNGGPVAIESDVPDDASRRNRAKKQSDASLWSAFSDDDDDASTSRVFQTRLASSSDVRARRSPIDDGFGLARCRGSGLRLPPPPASLPRAAEAPSLSRVIHDRRVAAARARGATTTIREARRGLGEKTWR
jgi:hypothetical protein